jgi:hypothetical protein
VAVNAPKARELIIHRQQVLKWSKWDRGQGEPLSEVKIPHVGLDQSHPILHRR